MKNILAALVVLSSQFVMSVYAQEESKPKENHFTCLPSINYHIDGSYNLVTSTGFSFSPPLEKAFCNQIVQSSKNGFTCLPSINYHIDGSYNLVTSTGEAFSEALEKKACEEAVNRSK